MARRRSVEVRREEILRATVEVVNAQGFAATRVADVAGALGVSTALVFYHFETKDRLLSEAFAYAAERDLERLASIASSRATAAGRLGRILTFYGPSPRPSQTWPLWIDAWAAALRIPELQEVSRRLDVHWKDTVAAVIAEGVATGEFTCPDAGGAAWRITALLDGLAVQATVHRGTVSRATMMRWVHDTAARELGLDGDGLRPGGRHVTPASSSDGPAHGAPGGRPRKR
jgi:AcrR family transcriptional regulator